MKWSGMILLVMACAAGCIGHPRVHVEPIEIAPIHVNVDVYLHDRRAKPAPNEAVPPESSPPADAPADDDAEPGIARGDARGGAGSAVGVTARP